jgi:hypothetical protein
MGGGGSGGKATAVSVRKSEVKNRGPKTEGQKQRVKKRRGLFDQLPSEL